MTTNQDKLIMQSVSGVVTHPVVRIADTRVDGNGRPFAYPSVGGITYNYTLGDSAFGYFGDHIEPDVSIKNNIDIQDKALNFLACIGNRARITSGPCKGQHGVVIGKHGGIEHVLVYFSADIKMQLDIGDGILIYAYGQGLAIDHCSVTVKNIDPQLLQRIVDIKDGVVEVEVAAIVPSLLMGSGTGFASSNSGDYDIMTADWQAVVANRLDKLSIGDIVAITDSDTRYGRGYRQGYITIGIVVHSNCFCLGHGPGVVTIMCGKKADINVLIKKDSNIARKLPYVHIDKANIV